MTTTTKTVRTPHRTLVGWAVSAAMLASLLAFALPALAAETVTVDPIQWQRFPVDTDEGRAAVLEKFGIELRHLRLTAADNMLDFRYKVIDPEKAAVLHGPKKRAYVIEPGGNRWVGVPKTRIGTFRQTRQPPKKDYVYTTMLGNPARHFKRGQTVDIALGELILQSVTIE